VLKYLDENDLEMLLNRGEAYLLNEQYDKGWSALGESYSKI
jgi:hypothetical protein